MKKNYDNPEVELRNNNGDGLGIMEDTEIFQMPSPEYIVTSQMLEKEPVGDW